MGSPEAMFRTTPLGGECLDIAANELALGSKRTETTGTFASLNFRVMHFGREAFVSYVCDADNRLSHGMYRYEFATREDAVRYWTTIKPMLIEELGQSYIDSTSPAMKEGLAKSDLRGSMSEMLATHVMWGFPSYGVQLAIVPRGGTQPGYDVGIV